MEEMIYGLLLTESPFTTMSEKEQFRKVSVDWHRLLGFRSSSQREATNPDAERRRGAEREAAELRRFRQMREVDVDVQLARFYGRRDAEFRGVQRAALEAVCNAEPFVLAVMPTGGGKSLLFMLLAAASGDGVTIVVVPMTALRQDMAERGNEKGIACEE
jgi:superfamily II DNA helicase RecQ